MSIFSSYKKIFLLGFIIIILMAIPFSVYIAQKRQNIVSKADKATTLSLIPASSPAKVGDTVTLEVWLDPGAGSTANQVSFVKFSIRYDSSKFSIVSGSLIENKNLAIIEGPTYESNKVSVSLSIGADPANVIAEKTKIASLQLKATSITSPTAPNVTFDTESTQVLSIDDKSETSDNVLSTTIPATITVTTSGTSTSALTAPSCVSLNADRVTTGAAPYPITFTAIGNDSDGTIKKVSFNFGDGPVQEITTGGAIGTNSVNVQISHSYNSPGTFTAYAILTDNNDNFSAQQGNCSKTVTISQAGASSGGAGGGTIALPTNPVVADPAQGVVVVPSPGSVLFPEPTLPPTGPGSEIVGIGILGAIFAIIGGVLLLL